MSVKKFEKMVDEMVLKAPTPMWFIMRKVGELLKITHSELAALKEFVPEEQPIFFSFIAGKNLGNRTRPVMREVNYPVVRNFHDLISDSKQRKFITGRF